MAKYGDALTAAVVAPAWVNQNAVIPASQVLLIGLDVITSTDE